MPPFPSLTKKWHDQKYDAIEPTRPELSTKGKTIVITGGGGSIGTALATAFAQAGATKIAVISRRENTLEETKKQVENKVKGAQVLPVKGDISDEDSIKNAFSVIEKELGKIHVLVCAAGYLPVMDEVMKSDPMEWWTGFEINVKGAFNVSRAFVPVAADDAVLVDISTCVVHMPAMASGSGYVASKLAATKVYETVGAETGIDIIHVHPGVVYSELNVKSGITAIDNANLPACFVVWAVSEEARFLRGKYLWSNWDVDELKSRKEELQKPDELIVTLNGWPFGQTAEGDALAH